MQTFRIKKTDSHGSYKLILQKKGFFGWATQYEHYCTADSMAFEVSELIGKAKRLEKKKTSIIEMFSIKQGKLTNLDPRGEEIGVRPI